MPVLKVKTADNGWVAVGGGTTGSSGSGTGGSSYTLPIANATTLGGVKPVSKTSEMTQAVGIDSEGRLYTKPGTGGSGSDTAASLMNRTTAVNVANTNYGTVMARGIYAGTTDMTDGVTDLISGVIYLVYEE